MIQFWLQTGTPQPKPSAAAPPEVFTLQTDESSKYTGSQMLSARTMGASFRASFSSTLLESSYAIADVDVMDEIRRKQETHADWNMGYPGLVGDCAAAAGACSDSFLAMLGPLGVGLDLQEVGKLLQGPCFSHVHLFGCLVV